MKLLYSQSRVQSPYMQYLIGPILPMLQFLRSMKIYKHIRPTGNHHFQEYKQATTAMVKSIVRIEASVIALESKQISASSKNHKYETGFINSYNCFNHE